MKKPDRASPEVQRIVELKKQGRYKEATGIALEMLDIDPNDYEALFELGHIILKDQHKGLAYNIFARAAKLYPEEPEIWLAYSQSHMDKPENWGRIEWCLKKAIKLYKKQNRNPAIAYSNMAMLYYIQGKLDEAQLFIDQALESSPDQNYCLTTQGFIHLAKGEWDKAWHLYDKLLNHKGGRREQYSYGDEGAWDGSPVNCLVINGEQGIGDEIMYASCINEAIERCGEVVIDCMPRLEGLFKRSFPKAYVYGQRWNKEVIWEKDHKPDAHIAMASLPRFFRHKDEDFSGEPYLQPDPDIKQAVRSVLDAHSKGRPKIGIAWSGGTVRTRGYLRKRTLDELLPVLRQDFLWVSLEYNDPDEEIKEFYDKRKVEISTFPWLTKKGLDYDLTAALISELDLVISVPTTAVQMAGAVGVPCWVIVPKYTGWIFYREKYPWANSVRVFKNTPIRDLANELNIWQFQTSQTLNSGLKTGLRVAT